MILWNFSVMYLTQKVLMVHPSSFLASHMGKRCLANEQQLLLLLLRLRLRGVFLYSAAHVCTILLNPEMNIHFTYMYTVCSESKCIDFLFKYLLDLPEITSDLLQSMTLGKIHSGFNVSSTVHSSTGSHFP